MVVRKPDGALRICGDFRELNAALVDDKYPLPRIDDLLTEIGNEKKYFAKFDLQSAFHQIPLATESQGLTTIVTHIVHFGTP